jgi:hypothetical protein
MLHQLPGAHELESIEHVIKFHDHVIHARWPTPAFGRIVMRSNVPHHLHADDVSGALLVAGNQLTDLGHQLFRNVHDGRDR